ncbi:hypothetical protein S7711_02361, partial [Stachybotrys chartarum IBT 7711]
MIAHGLYQILLDNWLALSATFAVVCVGLPVLAILSRTIALSHVPLIGRQYGGYEKRRKAYQENAQRLYSKGYQMGIFQLTTQHESPTVVVAPVYLKELQSLPDNILSVDEAVKETMHTKYTMMQEGVKKLPKVVKQSLTPALARLNPIISEEVTEALRLEIPPCDQWTSININQKLRRIVAIVSGRVLVGPELCHSEHYLDAAINYTTEAMAAMEAVGRVAPWKRPFIGKTLPQVQALSDRKAKETSFLKPVIEARQRIAETDRPDDMLQWLLDSKPRGCTHDIAEIADLQLSACFAAIHTTTMTLTNILYSLAVMPEMIKELRDEITTVLNNYDGIFSSQALQAMQKVDSFMLESHRCYASSLAAFQRKVLQPITLSNGQVIPAGVMIEVAAKSIMFDPERFDEPEKFDGLRFYKIRQLRSSPNANQFVGVSSDNLAFGYGRHACPGRFFAANEIKMILAHIILNYDIRPEEGVTKRYSNIELANLVSKIFNLLILLESSEYATEFLH